MLRGVKKIDRNTKRKPGSQYPPASKRQKMHAGKAGNQAKMTGHLQATTQVGFGVQSLQLCRLDQFAGGKGFFHCRSPSSPTR